MTDQERIEKLKKPDMAQPYGVYIHDKPEMARIIDRAGVKNLLILTCAGTWDNVAPIARIVPSRTYILQSGYEPKREYEDIEVVALDVCVCLDERAPGGCETYFLYDASVRNNFVGFYTIGCDLHDGGDEAKIALEEVATSIRDSYKVIARFVR